jgi:16S rRNA (uracil1498-N3)-methyltransferase
MTRRYFLSSPLTTEAPATVRLENEEAHHLLNVMRGKIGDEVTLFDGTGVEYDVSIERLEKRAVLLAVSARREVNRESTRRLHLGVALPKGDRQQWLCEKLVELGCEELTPLIARRSVAEPVEAAMTRLRRFVIEASKQCGRNRLMRIGSPMSVADFLMMTPPNTQCVFLDASGERFVGASEGVSDAYRAAVGPEGGWSEDEMNAAKAAEWRVVSLGARVLRVETAAIALAARLCAD